MGWVAVFLLSLEKIQCFSTYFSLLKIQKLSLNDFEKSQFRKSVFCKLQNYFFFYMMSSGNDCQRQLRNLMDLAFNAFYSLFDCSKNFNFVFYPAIKNKFTWCSVDRPRILNRFLNLNVFQVPIWSVRDQKFLDFSWESYELS